jgi:glycosyltransferase involved in cell wall biosynthesis
VDVHIVNLAIIRRKYFSVGGVMNRYQKWMQAVRVLNDLITTEQIDTVYSNTAAVLVGAYVARKNKLQHIWHIHEIIEQPVFLHKALAWCMRNWSDKIIVVSKAVEANWQDALNKSTNHITTNNAAPKPQMFQVYNGIAPVPKSAGIPNTNFDNYKQSLGIPDNALVIGMAARIHFWKGQSYFMNIARTLLALEQDNKIVFNNSEPRPLYFLIAGDPFAGYEYLQTELENSINAYNLQARVFYIGLVKEMDLFYTSIDLLILPSQQPDPLPTVVLEAMQYGKPVVATAQGGALEMVNNETGIFIPLNDAVEAANKIAALFAENNLAALGAAGKQRVDSYFSAAAFEKNILSVFEK